jgi:phosphoribosylaminoimidazolecarboxamide formyltransferase/IMP cyclohydrolase
MTAAESAGRRPLRRALISVSDKTGLVELARDLVAAGVVLVSTGSTAATIGAAGVAVTPVEEVSGFAECLDGRVKTLHPVIHAGLLADPGEDHERQLVELGIERFDLLVSSLYPFTETVASGAGVEDCIEQIDIGGPAMVRAAAKNHAAVAVVTGTGEYDLIRAALAEGGFPAAGRRTLAAQAFRRIADYDIAVATWLTDVDVADREPEPAAAPSWIAVSWQRAAALRYGENPHQAAAVYTETGLAAAGAGLAGATQLQGKEMSYNNYVDADAALRAAYDFTEPAVAVIKHTNPCGIAVASPGAADPIADAHARANDCDPVSAYGGVIAANRPVTAAMAEQILPIFTEVVLAPSFETAALDLLAKRKNVRVLVVPDGYPRRALERRPVSGGLLVQEPDVLQAAGDDPGTWTLATGPAADEATLADLAFAWRACRSVHSNAILLASGGASVGIGMGQVNRVDSARLAVTRAGDRVRGSVAASDAFFPFPDGLEVLLEAGVRAVVQPGGSIRDPEVIAAAEAAGGTLYLTGTRHFRH